MEKWPSIEFHGGGDNLQNDQNKRNSQSDSSSARCIRQCLENLLSDSSVSLDLSRKDLQHLTEDIYKLFNLKHLHLEGNALSMLPEDFFQQLPNLVWLDLRYNKMKELPPGIGFHKQLKTLLLEKNPVKRLPVELGNLTSLTALNLRHCPLEFPPPEVVQKGLAVILCFLRKSNSENLDNSDPVTPELSSPLEQEAKAIVREYKRKCDRQPERRKAFNDLWKQMSLIKMPPVEKLNLTDLMKSSLDLSDGWPNEEEMIRFQKLREEFIQDEREEYLATREITQDTTTALRRTRTKESISAKEGLSRKSSLLSSRGKKSLFPAVSSYDLIIQRKKAEECRLAALKEMKEKQALIEQRRKDKEVLQKWRKQAKLMKEKKEILYTFSSEKRNAVSQNAPYATNEIKDHNRLKDHEGPNKEDEQMEMPSNMTSMKTVEDLRAAKYKEVENRIKHHSQMMKERRKRLIGIPQEDMERALQDLETAENLEAELENMKKDLHKEYRFTAFTGEVLPTAENITRTTKPQKMPPEEFKAEKSE